MFFETDTIRIPVNYERNDEDEFTDALEDFHIRVYGLINFVAEVVVTDQLSKESIDKDILIVPNLEISHRNQMDVEFPNLEVNFNEWKRTIRRLPEQLFFSAVIRMATIFETYLSELISEVLYRHTELIKVDEKQLSTKEILEYDRIQDIEDTIIERKINSILMSSYPSLVQKLKHLLKIDIHSPRSTPTIFDIHDFLEVRNVIVHRDGTAGESYFNRMNDYNANTYIKNGKKGIGFVRINFKWFFKKVEEFIKHCVCIDELVRDKWKTTNS